jgi:hypothetical protein
VNERGRSLVKGLLGRGIAPFAGGNADDDDNAASLNTELVPVVNQLAGLDFLNDLEMVIGRHILGFGERLMIPSAMA